MPHPHVDESRNVATPEDVLSLSPLQVDLMMLDILRPIIEGASVESYDMPVAV